jgi:hypothetical protein
MLLTGRVLLCSESTIWVNRHDLMQHETHLDGALKKGLQEWEQVRSISFSKITLMCGSLGFDVRLMWDSLSSPLGRHYNSTSLS